MRRIPRHLFVPESQRESAYADWPLQIGAGQTISQPYIVGLMTQLAKPQPESRALDVGTGSGYQAAVLAELCREVYSIEIIEPLAMEARLRLADLGYRNVEVRCGDGYRGWPEHAPFDVIILAAAPAAHSGAARRATGPRRPAGPAGRRVGLRNWSWSRSNPTARPANGPKSASCSCP